MTSGVMFALYQLISCPKYQSFIIISELRVFEILIYNYVVDTNYCIPTSFQSIYIGKSVITVTCELQQ